MDSAITTMTQTSTFHDSRTNYNISETFTSETADERERHLRERLLLLMTKKLTDSGDKLDYNRPV